MDELAQTMTRYLLGELSESEQSALEEKYFTDPQVFNQILKTESELVDGYARGHLSADMRERFERSYMAHPSRSERVKFAAALTTRLDQARGPVTRSEQLSAPVSWWQGLAVSLRGRRLSWRLSIALASLLIILVGSWFFIQSRRQQEERESARIHAEREDLERRGEEQEAVQKLPAESPQSQGKPPDQEERASSNPQQTPQPSPTPTNNGTPPVVYLALNVGGMRGADGSRAQVLVIPLGTTQARLSLNLKDNSYPSYGVSLQMIGGAEIFSQTNIKPRSTKSGASFVFTVPARKLASGDYMLTLRGINPDGEVDDLSKSLFRVEKR